MLFASQFCGPFGLGVSFLPFQHPQLRLHRVCSFFFTWGPFLLHFCHRRPFKSGRRANCGNNPLILLPLCHAGGPPYNSLFLSQVFFFPPLGCMLIPPQITPQIHSLHCCGLWPVPIQAHPQWIFCQPPSLLLSLLNRIIRAGAASDQPRLVIQEWALINKHYFT